MTSLLHQFDHFTPFEKRMQEAEFRFLEESRAARQALAENYVGLPLDPAPVLTLADRA